MAKGKSSGTKYVGASASSAARSVSSVLSQYDKKDWQGNVIKAIYKSPNSVEKNNGIVYEDGSASRAWSKKSKATATALGNELSEKLGGVGVNTFTSGGINVIEISIPYEKLSHPLSVYSNGVKPNHTTGVTNSELKLAIDIQKWAIDRKYGGTISLRRVRKTSYGGYVPFI